ncbi:uncharacterized protein LOC134216550 [Armigeres subalbatus]|uniref:uncharacterized protein LOC134216550 n=1 Tax=Armigeres subalbatus TaxID=124917 RepID=UPI002ED3A9FC
MSSDNSFEMIGSLSASSTEANAGPSNVTRISGKVPTLCSEAQVQINQNNIMEPKSSKSMSLANNEKATQVNTLDRFADDVPRGPSGTLRTRGKQVTILDAEERHGGWKQLIDMEVDSRAKNLTAEQRKQIKDLMASMVNIYELSEVEQHSVESVDEPTLTTFTSAQCSMTSEDNSYEYHSEMDEHYQQMMPVDNFVIPNAAIDKMYAEKEILPEPHSSSTYYDFWNVMQHTADVAPFCTYKLNGNKAAKQKNNKLIDEQSEASKKLEAENEKLRQIVSSATEQTKIDQDQSAILEKQLEETRKQIMTERASALAATDDLTEQLSDRENALKNQTQMIKCLERIIDEKLMKCEEMKLSNNNQRANLERDQIFSSLMMMSISNHMKELELDISAKDALLAEQNDKYEIFREQSGILQAQLDLYYSESLNAS